jgi:hypothetical protein
MQPATFARARELLRQRGAEAIAHPGGTLLAHLERVRESLAAWGSDEVVQLAGLCHAGYGTDGFDTTLLELSERDTLAEVIGVPAERLVYLYGSCDRRRTYPALSGPEPIAFHDRFTGDVVLPDRAAVRAFLEITVANELDVAEHNATLAEKIGPWLQQLLSDCHAMLGPAAFADSTARAAHLPTPGQ